MFSTLRTRFGIPGVISVMALVFAMFGGAYAASNGNSGKATASKTKTVKGPRGPKGAVGPAGPQGPIGATGPNGDTGAAGANGTNGKDGINGTNGEDGTSVVASTEPSGTGNCEGRGGSKFITGATTTFACNGKDGTGGAGGGSLPTTLGSGETETGTWSLVGSGGPSPISPVSFPIPLSAEAAKNTTLHTAEAEGDATCTGNVDEPTAPPGVFCRYVSEESTSGAESPFFVYPPDFGANEGVGTSGALILGEGLAPAFIQVGSWAVTAS